MPRYPVKTPAEMRTVDIFTKRTLAEEKEEALREEELSQKKERKPITTESLTSDLTIYGKHVPKLTDSVRLIKYDKDTWYVERARNNGSSYTGMYFSNENLHKLHSMIQEALCLN